MPNRNLILTPRQRALLPALGSDDHPNLLIIAKHGVSYRMDDVNIFQAIRKLADRRILDAEIQEAIKLARRNAGTPPRIPKVFPAGFDYDAMDEEELAGFLPPAPTPEEFARMETERLLMIKASCDPEPNAIAAGNLDSRTCQEETAENGDDTDDSFWSDDSYLRYRYQEPEDGTWQADDSESGEEGEPDDYSNQRSPFIEDDDGFIDDPLTSKMIVCPFNQRRITQ